MQKLQIISGGQTGVDRAALDFALQNYIPCRGWCPKGRLADDGIIPKIYPLKETKTANYSERTMLNVKSSEGTLILYNDVMDEGTILTQNLCTKIKRPIWLQSLNNPINKEMFYSWLKNNRIEILNIAGPRESNSKGIYLKTIYFLKNVIIR